MPQEVSQQYKKFLEQYITHQNEEELYHGQQFSRRFIEKEIAPEDMISFHKSALTEIFPDISKDVLHSFDFLIEMMIHYGLALQEHQSLIRKQEAIQMEITVAARVQDTLLKNAVPTFNGIDIGFISKPAKKLNGDYVYFLHENSNKVCIALADVMGKGIPAALCMSMIKFGMDSLQGGDTSPKNVLDVVNRIVEKSVDDSMFISMFYGKFDGKDDSFSYASAGHEPALHFKAKEGTFTELDAKGLLLGVQPNVTYEEKQAVLVKGDFVVMMTDGVTEARKDEEFISLDDIKAILLEVQNESAQTIASYVYEKIAKLQDYNLSDDFTIVIFKKE